MGAYVIGGDAYVIGTSAYVIGASAPPVLSLPTSTPFSTAGILGCTTDDASGTLYGVVDLAVNITAITAAQVLAGDNNGDVAAIGSNNTAVSTTTPQTFVTGLDPLTLYSFALAQDNGLDSNVVTGTFTTTAATGLLDSRLGLGIGLGI